MPRGNKALCFDRLIVSKSFSLSLFPFFFGIQREQDPLQRASIETQILEFGQTPMQLFKSPHPRRRCAVARPLSEEGSRTRSKADLNETGKEEVDA